MYLLDTNLVSELRKVRSGKADPGVAAWADGVDASSLFLSSITLHELELGCCWPKGGTQPREPCCATGSSKP
jgi:predicted nucleic acid-binding protein